MKWLSIFALLFIASCTTTSGPATSKTVDTAVAMFEKITSRQISTRIVFGSMAEVSDNIVAICIPATFDEQKKYVAPKIIIKPSIWRRATTTIKIDIVLHELGHCELGLIHVVGRGRIMFYEFDMTIPTASKKGRRIILNAFGSYIRSCGDVNFSNGHGIFGNNKCIRKGN